MLQRKPPYLAPIAISENQLKFAAMRTVRCRVEKWDSWWRLLHEAYDNIYRDLNSRVARPGHNMDHRGTPSPVPNSAL